MKIDVDTIALVAKLVKKILKEADILDGSNKTEDTIEDVLNIIIKTPDILSLKADEQIEVVKNSLLSRN